MSAQSIIMMLIGLNFTLPLGYGSAAAIRLGQALGANEPKRALTSSRVAFTLGWITCTIICLLFITFRYQVPLAFTSDKVVVNKVADVLPIMAAFFFCDGTVGVGSGIFRGSGRQMKGFFIVLAAYTCGLPAAIYMMFPAGIGISGFWEGLAIAVAIEGIAFTVMSFRTDWDHQAVLAQIRLGIITKEQANLQSIEVPMQIISNGNVDDDDKASVDDINKEVVEIDQKTEMDESRKRKMTLRQLLVRRGAVVSVILSLFIGSIIFRITWSSKVNDYFIANYKHA